MENADDPFAELRQLEREFYKIDEDAIHLIRKHMPRLMQYAETALETVFDHLKTNPVVADYFADEDNMGFLRSGMIAHCNKVLSGRYDPAYYDAASQLGLRHSKLDYPSFVYSAAYTNMLMSMKTQALADKRPLPASVLEALDRVALYDLELTQAAFYRHQIEKVSALNADAAKVRALMDTQSDAA